MTDQVEPKTESTSGESATPDEAVKQSNAPAKRAALKTKHPLASKLIAVVAVLLAIALSAIGVLFHVWVTAVGVAAALACALAALIAPRFSRSLVCLCTAVAVLDAAAVACLGLGIIAPAGAAARYEAFGYIQESDVTTYIETYKTQMVGADATDEQWVSFLSAYNLTPERLRLSTIDQLATNNLIREKCTSLGITASSDEVNAAIDVLKQQTAFGSDELWQQTLEQYGQTEEGLYTTYELALLKQKLCTSEVAEETASDDEVRSGVESFVSSLKSSDRSRTLKHTYCFKVSKSDSEGSLDQREEVQKIRDGLEKTGVTAQSFAAVVSEHSDDETLKENGGANGWDADRSQYGDEYVKLLEETGANGLSNVGADDDSYFFIWVNDTYTLPASSKKIKKLNLEKMPDTLLQYFRDSISYQKWQSASDEYLNSLPQQSGLEVYPMPSDVPYNVDMN